MASKTSELQKKISEATCLQDLIVRKAPHNFPVNSVSVQHESGRANRARILSLMLEFDREVNVDEIAKITGLSYQYTHALMTELHRGGLLAKKAIGCKKLYWLS